MKRLVSLLLCAILLFTSLVFSANALNEEVVGDCLSTLPPLEGVSETAESRVTGLIYIYALEISVTGSSIKILAETYCDDSVVKSGFKNLIVQRKKVTDSSWSDYHDYGNLYSESYSASINTTLAVESGYQYRVSCKHYAKKNILLTQSISNTSNVVYVS